MPSWTSPPGTERSALAVARRLGWVLVIVAAVLVPVVAWGAHVSAQGTETVGAGQVPAAPANQRYEYRGSSIVLSWDASAGAASYTVYYDDFFGSACRLGRSGSPSFCDELATGLTGTSYTHTDPDASRNYYWVVACNSHGCSEIDRSNPAQLGGAPPAAPANQRYEYSGSAIVLSWDASAGATSYTVYHDDFFDSACRLGRSGSPSFCDELATDLTGTSYTHSDPDRDENYYWVVACNSFGCSAIDSANPAPPGGAAPAAPTNQRYEYDGAAIVLSWDASEGADSYTVYHDDFFGSACRLGRSGSPSFCDELATNLSGTSYTHSDPDRDENYYWVVACNSFGCSAIDSANPAPPGGLPPAAPANQRHEYDGAAIVLSWDASAGAASYTVYHDDFFGSACRLGSRGPSFCEELATGLTGTSYTHGDPDASRNYYWVVACNSFGCSAIDSANPAPPGGAAPAAPANQRYEHDGAAIVLSWDASAGAASYTVYHDDFFGSACRLGSRGPSFCEELATGLTGTSYTHSAPDASRNYYWVVACNSFGCSAIDSANPAPPGGAAPAGPRKPALRVRRRGHRPQLGRLRRRRLVHRLPRRLLRLGLPAGFHGAKLLRGARHRPGRHELHARQPRPRRELLLDRRLQQLRLLGHHEQRRCPACRPGADDLDPGPGPGDDPRWRGEGE